MRRTVRSCSGKGFPTVKSVAGEIKEKESKEKPIAPVREENVDYFRMREASAFYSVVRCMHGLASYCVSE